MILGGLLLALLLSLVPATWVPAWAATFVASPNGNDAAGTPCTDAQPCSSKRAILTMNCSNNDVVELLDGVYRGTNYLLQIGDWATGKSGTDATHRCTVRARNDGQVFIDGQDATYPFWMNGNSWWSFSGLDVGNAGGSPLNSVIEINNSHNNEFKRMCASNVQLILTGSQADGIAIVNSSHNLLEDVCSFGTAGNNVIEFGSGSGTNTFRRLWTRWEGHGEYTGFDGGPDNSDCGGPPFQIGYGTHQTSTYENIVTVYQPDQVTASNGCYDDTTPGSTGYGSTLIRDSPFSGDSGYRLRGWIAYGKNTDHHFLYAGGNGAWFNQANGGTDNGGAFAIDIQDFFLDALSLPSSTKGPIGLGCVSGACSGMNVSRVTSLRGTVSSIYSNSGQYSAFTNINECASLGACPNFYTGDSPGTGARSCFEYSDGTLTGTKLWPWRMDDRIKAALARANAAGRGGTPLQGGAGSGYAAGTVTSEIAARYGAIPSACNRSGSFTPSFPVATDFPSTPVLDDFNRANGAIGSNWTTMLAVSDGPFTIASNVAAAPANGFARMQWNAATFSPSHEVYGTWPGSPPPVAANTMLTFAGVAGSDNSQWRLYLTRSASANSTVEIRRISGAGAATTILGPIDLGTDWTAGGQLLGVRVSPLQLITVYWKYTDGVTYRIGSVIDSNLPAGGTNSAIGTAASTPVTIEDFGGGTCCGGAVSPSNIGRFGNLFPKQ